MSERTDQITSSHNNNEQASGNDVIWSTGTGEINIPGGGIDERARMTAMISMLECGLQAMIHGRPQANHSGIRLAQRTLGRARQLLQVGAFAPDQVTFQRLLDRYVRLSETVARHLEAAADAYEALESFVVEDQLDQQPEDTETPAPQAGVELPGLADPMRPANAVMPALQSHPLP